MTWKIYHMTVIKDKTHFTLIFEGTRGACARNLPPKGRVVKDRRHRSYYVEAA